MNFVFYNVIVLCDMDPSLHDDWLVLPNDIKAVIMDTLMGLFRQERSDYIIWRLGMWRPHVSITFQGMEFNLYPREYQPSGRGSFFIQPHISVIHIYTSSYIYTCTHWINALLGSSQPALIRNTYTGGPSPLT